MWDRHHGKGIRPHGVWIVGKILKYFPVVRVFLKHGRDKPGVRRIHAPVHFGSVQRRQILYQKISLNVNSFLLLEYSSKGAYRKNIIPAAQESITPGNIAFIPFFFCTFSIIILYPLSHIFLSGRKQGGDIPRLASLKIFLYMVFFQIDIK